MGRLVALVFVVLLFLGAWWVNDLTAAHNNITCKKQVGASTGVRYELCIAGQSQPQYVPYPVWRSARVGGYYDEGTHGVFSTVDDDPKAPHGIFHGITDDSGGHTTVHSDGGE